MSDFDANERCKIRYCPLCAYARGEMWLRAQREERRDAFTRGVRTTARAIVALLAVATAVAAVLLVLACGGGWQPARKGDRPLRTGNQPAPAATVAVTDPTTNPTAPGRR